MGVSLLGARRNQETKSQAETPEKAELVLAIGAVCLVEAPAADNL